MGKHGLFGIIVQRESKTTTPKFLKSTSPLSAPRLNPVKVNWFQVLWEYVEQKRWGSIPLTFLFVNLLGLGKFERAVQLLK